MIKFTCIHIADSDGKGDIKTDIRFLKIEDGQEPEILSLTLTGVDHNEFWGLFNNFASVYEAMTLPVPENVEQLILNKTV